MIQTKERPEAEDVIQESEVNKMSAVKDEMIQKWETKVSDLAKETGYDFDFLWSIWTEMLQEDNPIHKTDEEKWEHFEGISHEYDW